MAVEYGPKKIYDVCGTETPRSRQIFLRPTTGVLLVDTAVRELI